MNLKKSKALRKFVTANFKWIGIPYMYVDESGGHLEKHIKRYRPKLAYIGIPNHPSYVFENGQVHEKKVVGTVRLNPDCVRGVYQLMKETFKRGHN